MDDSQQANRTTPADDSQFVVLLTDVQLPLVLYVRSLMPANPSAAKDVAQQANVKMWEKRQDYQLGTNFKAWAFSIARYEVLNYRKRSARDAKLMFRPDLQEAITQDLAITENELESKQEALMSCLATLRPNEKQLIMHRYASAGTLAEYAKQAGRSVGGLKVTLHRLRNRLLDCIRRKLAAEVAP
ncbi:MAG: sigma-70 family RNA polymerase sigma factor [Planctomycetota bacterium]